MDYQLENQFLGKVLKGFLKHLKMLFLPCNSNDYKPKFLQSKTLFYCALTVFIFKIFIIIASVNLPANIFFADITKNALVNFVNQGREQAGLESLNVNEKLDHAAYLKALDMLNNKYFYHVSPTGTAPWYWFSEAGYNYEYAGENLAVGFIDSKEVYDAWYNSPSHRQNILNPEYKEIGTAVMGGFGSNDAIVVVQMFGTKARESSLMARVEAANKTKTLSKTNNTEIEKPVQETQNTEPKQTPKNKFVLSQSSGLPGEKSLMAKYMGLISYNYEGLLQNMIYAFISIIALAFMVNLVYASGKSNKSIAFRALLLVILLFSASLVSKEMVITIIPHTLMIYE